MRPCIYYWTVAALWGVMIVTLSEGILDGIYNEVACALRVRQVLWRGVLLVSFVRPVLCPH